MDFYNQSLIHNSNIKKNSNDIPLEIIEEIIDVCRWAPSPFNSQPWEFLIIDNVALKNKIVDFVKGKDPEIQKQIKNIIIDAPKTLVVLYNKSRMDPGKNADKLGLICLGACLDNIYLYSAVKSIKIEYFLFSNETQDLKLFLKQMFSLPKYVDIALIKGLWNIDKTSDISFEDKKIFEQAEQRILQDRYPEKYTLQDKTPVSINDDVADLIAKRKSYRKKYLAKKIKKEHKELLIKSAFYAPSFCASNEFNWKMILIEEKSIIKRLSQLIYKSAEHLYMDEKYYAKMKSWMRFSVKDMQSKENGIFTYILFQSYGKLFEISLKLTEVPYLKLLKKIAIKIFSKAFFYDLVYCSPLLIGLAYDKSKAQKGIEEFQNDMMSIGAALQNILLTMTSIDLGAQFLSVMFDVDESKEEVIKVLNLTDELDIVDMIRVGYIDKTSKPPKSFIVQGNVRHKSNDIIYIDCFDQSINK